MNTLSYGFIIPCYRHGTVLGTVLAQLAPFGFPLIVVDDGNDAAEQDLLAQAIAPYPQVTLLRHETNRGKGVAMVTGMTKAQELALSHVIQIDADGQHDVTALPQMLKLSAQEPQALISGLPQYDDSIPTGRLLGRYITHFWVWVETMSFDIKDSMCGMRIYPLPDSLTQSRLSGHYMDYDTEVMVRLYWQGHPVRFVPVKVSYPQDGHSNFRLFQDNVKISLMHTRLVATGLWRLITMPFKRTAKQGATAERQQLPRVATVAQQQGTTGAQQQEAAATHWAQEPERLGLWGMRIMIWVYKLLGMWAFTLLLYPVIAVFYCTAKPQRAASAQFLSLVRKRRRALGMTDLRDPSVFKHFYNFGLTLLDKVASWQGDIKLGHEAVFAPRSEQVLSFPPKQGRLLLVSHLGDIELCRALVATGKMRPVTALVFHENAQRFTAIMQAFAPNSTLNLIALKDFGPELMIDLKERLERGELIAIAADRLAVPQANSATHRVLEVDFMGQKAPLAQGPFILATLLKCPVMAMFALREGTRRVIYAHELRSAVKVARAERQAFIQALAQDFAQLLEQHALTHPYDWFNFFDFWQQGTTTTTHG
ncbi:MAG: glycosyltransferase family 2 protein [Candidatus Anaerobiospirillum pullicola]|uniref:Glycosyltransferase family 2 protein n=1 Tax=Candidatus Anaerobiospirillum pullicola TaxID=2838451 RepID=A0A948TH92_9GAMM|nr:glycosyltransferase family 2 protein [Candidatus Anaerobiospirillum pullicola]